MSFPSTLSSFARPNPTDRLNSPSHSALHNTVSSALGQVEAVIGVEGAASVVGTIEYFIKSPASDGGGHVQTANRGGTGQTSYNKGDLLIAQSSSVLSKLVVGSDGKSLRSDSTAATGVVWGSGNTIPTIRSYTNASVLTWTKPAGLAYVHVRVQAGGGAGGAVNADASGGGGGGGGGYTELWIPASALGTTVQVNVAASIAGNGGYSGFGGFASVSGGTAGGAGNSQGVGAGGAGGLVGIGGDVIIVGGNGLQGGGESGTGVNFGIGGAGGHSPLGFGGSGSWTVTSNQTAGLDGVKYGGGGGGASRASGATSPSGGLGAQGTVIVEEY